MFECVKQVAATAATTCAVNGGAELRMTFDPLRDCRSERWPELSRGMVFNFFYLRTCILTRD